MFLRSFRRILGGRVRFLIHVYFHHRIVDVELHSDYLCRLFMYHCRATSQTLKVMAVTCPLINDGAVILVGFVYSVSVVVNMPLTLLNPLVVLVQKSQNILLMAAAYKAGDDNSGVPLESTSSLLGDTATNSNSTNSLHPLRSSPPHASQVERNASGDINDDEQNLRTTCDGCTISKIKCDGGHPCKRCLRRRSECVYREKK